MATLTETPTPTRKPDAAHPRGSAPDTPAGARRRRGLDTLTGWAFVAPAMVIILGLSIFPAVWAFVLSLQKWNGFAPPKFVGGANYAKLMSDDEFWAAVSHTGLYVVLFVPASVLAGLFLAVALNRNIAFIGLYRTAIFVPFVASAAATGILSTYLFSPQYGLANNVLRAVGLPAQQWLEDANQAMLVIAIMSLWGQAAFTTVIYLAALQDVPSDLLEAARIDGANRWQTFWRIVWPELSPVTVFVTIWQTIGALQLFDLVYTTTRGGPYDSTKTIVYYLWDKAFRALDFGGGSAAAYVLFAATLLITIGMVVYARSRKMEAF
jgi:multiple sugar transport system permease protein